ncbi:MAG: emp24/gp25L/p24 family protein [Planctomycetes bacterium]|nr:emp24/gp25L/p24 family protein [Planctomycetota bacterium]
MDTSRGAALGEAVPSGQRPQSSPTPRLIWFQREPYGPVKVDPRKAQVVPLGRLEQGTQVRAVVTVEFNRGISNLTGTPDIDLKVEGPTGVVTQIARARNGTQLVFQTPQDGEYQIVLGNEYSQINAKQVGLQFLSP